MATSNKAIGERVRSLLSAHGMTQAGLAGVLDVDPGGVSRAISGERAFKAREIALIAEAFNVSPAVILEGAAAEEPALFAARHSSYSHGAVADAIRRAEFFIELANLVDTRHPRKALKAKRPDAVDYVAGQDFAERVLAETGLDSAPLPLETHALAASLEHALGIEFALEPMLVGLDGLAVRSSRFSLAMVSSSTAPARQRWTMAHETAHLVFGDAEDVLVDRNIFEKSAIETRANAFAGAFLMPEHLLADVWGSQASISEARVATMLDAFGVSQQALAFRLHNVGLVNAAGRDKILALQPLVSLIRNQGTRQSEGFWLPSRISRDAIQAYKEGRLGVRWVAELAHLEVDELLARLAPDGEERESLVDAS